MTKLRVYLEINNCISEKQVEKLNKALISIFNTYDFIITTENNKNESQL